jgi:hypothetical protein
MATKKKKRKKRAGRPYGYEEHYIKALEMFHRFAEKMQRLKLQTVVRQTFNAIKRVTPVDTGNAKKHWRLSGSHLFNAVDYIIYLEGGTSRQARDGMVETTVKEMEKRFIAGEFDKIKKKI